MKKKFDNKIKIEVTILIILLFIFFGLIFGYSINLNSVEIEYVTEDRIYVDNNDRVKIGEVSITNPNLLPARVYLQEFVACVDYNKTKSIRNLYVDYSKSDLVNNYEGFLGIDSSGNRYLDIGPSQTINSSLVISYLYMNEPESNMTDNENGKLVLFKTKYDSRWNQNCMQLVNEEMPYKLIDIVDE